MKRSFAAKFVALLLTAAFLVIAVTSAVSIVQLVRYKLYTDNVNDFLYKHKQLDNDADKLAEELATRYVVKNLSNCDEETLYSLGYRKYVDAGLLLAGINEESYSYTVSAKNGEVLESVTAELTGDVLSFKTRCKSSFPVAVAAGEEALIDEQFGKDYIDTYTETLENGETVTIREYHSPEYVVTVSMRQDSLLIPYGTSLQLLELLHSLRYVLIIVLVVSTVLFITGTSYLCVIAGKSSRNEPVHRGALNYMPLDIYAVIGGLLSTSLLPLATNLIYNWTNGKNYNMGTLTLVSFLFLAISFIFLGFVYAIATQVKLPKGYWYRNSFLFWAGQRLSALLRLVPVMWRLLLTNLLWILCVAGSYVWTFYGYYWPLMISTLLAVGVICYSAYAFGCLVQGAKRMSQGNLNAKLDTRYLMGTYKDCADHLNHLADVAIVAARKQMQSDRMKTELITNVSHDIKTPLTSIINYVDILQHVQSKEDSEQYLEVLGRQSQRLKKLIEDLMELSRASTGNMPVHILPLNATETVNQALGEFSDKLEQAGLELVFQPPEEEITMLADGRMSWRVLSNLFSNTVKYAMPGTRVYLELHRQSDWVLISLKNISREPLNISAEELTERFVRGDVSRNTEGSGLGLNIAKSLMELQHGQLRLRVDGDLFKATLMFPIAPATETEEA